MYSTSPYTSTSRTSSPHPRNPPPLSTILSSTTHPCESTATPRAVSTGSSSFYSSTYVSDSRATSSTHQLIPGSSTVAATGHTDALTFDDGRENKAKRKAKDGKLKRLGRKLLRGVKRLIAPREKAEDASGVGIDRWMDGVLGGRESGDTSWDGEGLEDESVSEEGTVSEGDFMTQHGGSSPWEICSRGGGRWGKESTVMAESTCAESTCTCPSCVREADIKRATFGTGVGEKAASIKQTSNSNWGVASQGGSKHNTVKDASTCAESTCTCSSCARKGKAPTSACSDKRKSAPTKGTKSGGQASSSTSEDCQTRVETMKYISTCAQSNCTYSCARENNNSSAFAGSDKGKSSPTNRTKNSEGISSEGSGSTQHDASTCVESTCTCSSCTREHTTSASASSDRGKASPAKLSERGRSAGSTPRSRRRESYLVALFVPEFSRKELLKKRRNQSQGAGNSNEG